MVFLHSPFPSLGFFSADNVSYISSCRRIDEHNRFSWYRNRFVPGTHSVRSEGKVEGEEKGMQTLVWPQLHFVLS